jgi:two-component system, OmpR family, response regulator
MKNMRILVIEDEYRIAHTIKKGLEQERYAVDISYRGDEGLDLATTEDYDLILLDVMLPGIDGVTVCRTLRKKEVHTPILMLTAKSLTDDKVGGLDAGADDYLQVADLSLNTVTYEVQRGDQRIILSSKEFAFLEYMMRNANTVLTKEQIMNHVWNYDADILPNTIEVYIRNIRNKVDKPFKDKPDLIKTVRGFGYKIGT